MLVGNASPLRQRARRAVPLRSRRRVDAWASWGAASSAPTDSKPIQRPSSGETPACRQAGRRYD